MSRPAAWASRHRDAVLVVLGVSVVAVPSAFAEFAELQSWSLWIRVPLGLVWIVAAVWTVLSATNQDGLILRHVRESRMQIAAKDDRVLAYILGALLCDHAADAPSQFAWIAAVWEEPDLLVPVYPEKDLDLRDPRVFRVGTGASGTAFERNSVVTALGDAVSNSQFHLTDEQAEYFKDYRAVASAPLVGGLGRPFGVLSAISKPEDGYFESSAASEKLRNLAEAVATALLKLSPDD